MFVKATAGGPVASWLWALFVTALVRFWGASLAVVLLTVLAVAVLARSAGDALHWWLPVAETLVIGAAALIECRRTTIGCTLFRPRIICR